MPYSSRDDKEFYHECEKQDRDPPKRFDCKCDVEFWGHCPGVKICPYSGEGEEECET